MQGTRSFTDDEVIKVIEAAKNGNPETAARNVLLISTGLYCGFRVSEILSLKVGDFVSYEISYLKDLEVPVFRPKSVISLQKKHTKKKTRGRECPVHANLMSAIEDYIKFGLLYGILDLEKPKDSLARPAFFSSLNGRWKDSPLTVRGAEYVFEKIKKDLALDGRINTHSARKTLAQRVYGKDHDIMLTKTVLGHQSISSTQAYLSLSADTVKNAFLNSI